MRPQSDFADSLPPSHGLHQTGLSIDTRYLAAGGNGNPLNGLPGIAEEALGTHRLNFITNAQGGNVQAQRDVISWIRQNRVS